MAGIGAAQSERGTVNGEMGPSCGLPVFVGAGDVTICLVPRVNPHHVLIANAVFYGLFGALLILAPTSGLFENFGLPEIDPELFTQLAGGMMLVFAVLLWEAPVDPVLQRQVGRAAAAANVLTGVVLVLWLLSGELDAETRGTVLLWAVAVVSVVFAVLESRYLRAT